MAVGDGEVRASLDEVVDEVSGDGALGTDVGELGGDTEEEGVLPAHGLVDVARVRSDLLALIGHISVSDLGDGSKVESDGQESDEAGNAKIGELNTAEVLAIGANILEDDIRGQKRSDDGADSLDGLGKLETELGVLWRTADGNVRVGRSLKSRQARADDEHGAAEATEGTIDGGRPEHQSTDAVKAETENEGVAVSESAEEPTRVCERANEVGAKVGTLETRGHTLGDVERNLEAGVEDVEESISKTPEEEEDRDQGDGEDRLSGGELGSTSDLSVGDALAPDLVCGNID